MKSLLFLDRVHYRAKLHPFRILARLGGELASSDTGRQLSGKTPKNVLQQNAYGARFLLNAFCHNLTFKNYGKDKKVELFM
jgi:hypothetical protein